jgi:hypothetical protein
MTDKKMKRFKGSIVIGDPSYFIKSDDDYQRCEYGKKLSVLGFSDYLYLEFPDDPQIVINTDTGKVLGGICQDSCSVAVVYKSELEKHNPNYEEAFGDKSNRTVIEDFDGEIDCEIVPAETDYGSDTDTVITGTGNINFRSCYEEDLS